MNRWSRAGVACLGISALAALGWLGAALAGDPLGVPPPAPQPNPIATAVDAGRHARIDGPHGPVHVWIPASYSAPTGATIVYVHGYWDAADTAWTGHQLPQQFALSALNAMFIVPEAPTAQKLPVNYPNLGELLALVEQATGVVRGGALTAVVGHSGAYRTIESWLDEPLVDQVIMVDALYGDEDNLIYWYRQSPRRRLIMVGQDTILGTEALATKVPETFTLDRFPPTYDTWPAAAKTARIVYIRSQYQHMPLVTEGIVLPSLLRLLPVELLGDQPWSLPLGSLTSLPAMPDLDDAGVAPAD
ncbi:MAG: hypothetical protein AB7P03_23955 [Kofleriaceae bacterium]